MAASELASGRAITVKPVPDEIIWFLLAKEFGWDPETCKRQSSKDIKAITHILSVYNKVKNQMAERESRRAKLSKPGKQFIDID